MDLSRADVLGDPASEPPGGRTGGPTPAAHSRRRPRRERWELPGLAGVTGEISAAGSPHQPSFWEASLSRSRETFTPPSHWTIVVRIEYPMCWSVAYTVSVYGESGSDLGAEL